MTNTTRLTSFPWGVGQVTLMILLLCSCERLEMEHREFVSRVNEPIVRYNEEKDVAYGKSKEYQSFDIYYPENAYRNPSDVVILIHGGNWNYGDKWFLEPTVDGLKKARKNLTIVNINYRLFVTETGKTLFEHQIADIDSCISFLKKNAEKYNIQRGKYAIMGASAGGHLALSYAYTLGKKKIHTVVGMSAITETTMPDLLHPNLWNDVKNMSGYQDGNPKREVLYKTSPVHLASTESPRTILIYGLKDNVIDLRQQTLLRERLLALRVPNALYVIKDQDHNIDGSIIADSILGALGADEWDLYFESL